LPYLIKENDAKQRGEEVMGNQEAEQKVWLTPSDCAVIAGISLSQVYSYMRQQPPAWPFYRVTTTKRLTKPADLDAWLEKKKVSADTQERERIAITPIMMPAGPIKIKKEGFAT